MSDAPQRNLKARYHVTGPFMENVTYNKCWLDKETKSLQQEEVTEPKEVFHCRFPQGHSIRVVGRKELIRLGLHIKPRIVDMDTGDVVEVGGGLYDFGNDPFRDKEVHLIEDDDTMKGSKSKATKAQAEVV